MRMANREYPRVGPSLFDWLILNISLSFRGFVPDEVGPSRTSIARAHYLEKQAAHAMLAGHSSMEIRAQKRPRRFGLLRRLMTLLKIGPSSRDSTVQSTGLLNS